MLLKPNNLIEEVEEQHKEWEISFNIKPLGKRGNYPGIFHVKAANGYGAYGDRNPLFIFHSDSLKVQISTAVSGKPWYNKSFGEFSINTISHILVKQFRTDADEYIYAIYINRTLKFNTTNTRPRSFKNVKVYAAPPGTAGNAVLSNLRYRL